MSDGHSDFFLQILCLDVNGQEVYSGDTLWYSDSWGSLKKSRAMGTGHRTYGTYPFELVPYLLLQDDTKIELTAIGGRSPRVLRENP